MRKQRYIDLYLNLIIPFVYTYISIIVLKNLFSDGFDNNVLEVISIVVLSFIVMYGILSIIRDLKEFGAFETLKYWFKKLKK